MNQTLSNILKVKKLNNIMQIINKYKDSENYKEAYYKAAAMLEFININLVMKYYKIKLEDTDIIKFIEIYDERDEQLARKLISINGDYNMIDTNNITETDLQYLLIDIDDILEHITQKYGNSFLE